MFPDYPKRLTRYYVAHLLWLVEYGTPSDLAMVPPSVRAWVREVRTRLPVASPTFRFTTTPVTGDLLILLRRERSPLI